jgi:diguanylate cyclase (GGDEF)-like protein/PAS domain S-box-containing protein
MRSDGVPRNGSSLRASEMRYRRLFETAKDGILILDGDSGLVVDANPYLENLLGYAHDELVGRALWELAPDVHVAASREAFQRLQVTEYARYENLPLETKGKEFLEVEFISNVYLVDEKRVIQCNIRDITERRRVALDLQAANEEMAALVVTLQERDVEMQQLHRLSSLLQACNTQGEACRVIALMAGELFAKQGGCLAVVKPGGTELEVVAQWGRPQFVAPAFPAHECWAIRRGQPHEVEFAGGGLPCRHYIEQDHSEHLCIPLMVQGESLGLLSFVSEGVTSESARHGRRNLALALGEAVKLSLYNLRLQARLREQANRDPLTGLFNRRYLEDSLTRELHRAHRLREQIGLAMLDLDFFKQFNDAFGHEAGDHLLLQVGQVLGSALRQSDIACRYGGEEFVLVFPNTSLPDTTRRVEEIRALVRGLALRHEDRLLGAITLSAGVAASPDHGTTARELLAASDEAMYAAKRGGRDRLVSCSRTHGAADTAIIAQEPGMSGRSPVIGTPGLVRWRTPHSQGEMT